MPPRLSMDACPACERPQAPIARYCGDCGTPLVGRCPSCDTINLRVRASCHQCGASLRGAATDPAVPGGATGAGAGARPDVDPERPRLSDALDALDPGGGAPSGDPPTPAGRLAGGAADGDDDELRRRRKAERRAALRRAQCRIVGPAATQDALVLEADAPARARLGQCLDLFGFRTVFAVTVPEAEGLSLRRPQAAVFVGVGACVDGDAAAALCRRLQEARQDRPLALIAVLDAGDHADRVRLQLAGVDALLLRPVGRGDVARALDACGLALPHDPRAGAELGPPRG
jgi:hypothetical protein